jgi:hypothetical protein
LRGYLTPPIFIREGVRKSAGTLISPTVRQGERKMVFVSNAVDCAIPRQEFAFRCRAQQRYFATAGTIGGVAQAINDGLRQVAQIGAQIAYPGS